MLRAALGSIVQVDGQTTKWNQETLSPLPNVRLPSSPGWPMLTSIRLSVDPKMNNCLMDSYVLSHFVEKE